MTLWGAAALAVADEGAPGLLVLGDSLSAGYGLETQQSWVSLLQQRLRAHGLNHRVINAGISGDTTRGALARLPQTLAREQPVVAVVALGGNDGLRGLSLQAMEANLSAIIETLQAAGTQVVLAAVRLPPNYGAAYTDAFGDIYRRLARRYQVALVPRLLDRVADDPALMQDDGIHPRAEAQSMILDNVWLHLAPLLPLQRSL